MLAAVSEHRKESSAANEEAERAESLKREAAHRALTLVESGMTLGLGTGSTAYWLIAGIGEKLRSGALKDVRAVPTSNASRSQAQELGIPLVELPVKGVDLAIDGMDELAPGLHAIKGLGAALTREKIVAAAADRFVLIGDRSKLVTRLGERAPVPVEVIRFGHERTAALLQALGTNPELRLKNGEPLITDNGNLVYDCAVNAGFDAPLLATNLNATPGVVEHGLFLGMAERAFVATNSGVLELTPEPRE